MTTQAPTQPLGYINSRLTEVTVDAPFKSAQLVSYLVDRNNPTERGSHPDYLGAKVTKADQIFGNFGEVVCYERTVNGYATFADMQSGDTAWITEEAAAVVYVKPTLLDGRVVWVHLPAHKVAEAGGDPYKVQTGFYAKQGRYLPC